MALLAFSSLDDFIAFTQDNQAIIDFEGVTRDQMAGLTELVSEELRSRDGSTAGVRTKIRLADKRAALMDLAKLIQMIGPERLEHTGPGGGAIQHEHKHAHVVLNPRDMTPKQRAQLKAVLLSIERGQDDEEDDDGGDEQAGLTAEWQPRPVGRVHGDRGVMRFVRRCSRWPRRADATLRPPLRPLRGRCWTAWVELAAGPSRHWRQHAVLLPVEFFDASCVA